MAGNDQGKIPPGFGFQQVNSSPFSVSPEERYYAIIEVKRILGELRVDNSPGRIDRDRNNRWKQRLDEIERQAVLCTPIYMDSGLPHPRFSAPRLARASVTYPVCLNDLSRVDEQVRMYFTRFYRAIYHHQEVLRQNAHLLDVRVMIPVIKLQQVDFAEIRIRINRLRHDIKMRQQKLQRAFQLMGPNYFQDRGYW